ncbi:MAG: hypothetical protein ACYS21_20460 [Planctomycetota bacterium]
MTNNEQAKGFCAEEDGDGLTYHFTSGPYLANNAAGKHDQEPDGEMADWMSHVVATMPYRDPPESDRPNEKITHQAVCIAKGRTVEEAVANAYLFSIAPDLFMAAWKLIDRIKRHNDTFFEDLCACSEFEDLAEAVAKVVRKE